MKLKERKEPVELLRLRYLNARMDLPEKEKLNYLNLEKGYAGEIAFDKLAENLPEERYIINDLLLELNNSYFQIDSLVISQRKIRLLDIKNYQGDFYYQNDKFYLLKNKKECKNPFDQLKRSTTLFHQLLNSLKMNFQFDSSVIFINPAFTLYQAPLDLPAVFPSQVDRFLSDISNTPSKLTDGHKKLAQTLLSLHQTYNPLQSKIKYEYDQLTKGIYCSKCQSFMIFTQNIYVVCGACGAHERIEQAIFRNVKEYMVLFPEKMITTASIFEWCKADVSNRTILRTLRKYFESTGRTRDTYFLTEA